MRGAVYEPIKGLLSAHVDWGPGFVDIFPLQLVPELHPRSGTKVEDSLWSDPYMSTGGACDLPRSAGNRGSKTVIGNPVERLGEFGNHLVFPRAGTEYYLLIDKAYRSSQLLTDPIFS